MSFQTTPETSPYPGNNIVQLPVPNFSAMFFNIIVNLQLLDKLQVTLKVQRQQMEPETSVPCISKQ